MLRVANRGRLRPNYPEAEPIYNSALHNYLKVLIPMLSSRLGPNLDGSGTSIWPSLALFWVVCGDFRCPTPAIVLVPRLAQVRVPLKRYPRSVP